MPRAMERQPAKSFQDMILTLHDFWSANGCLILQPYDMRMGAGTFHPATTQNRHVVTRPTPGIPYD